MENNKNHLILHILNMQFYTVFSQENFFLSTLSTGRCRKPVDVDKSFSNLCRSWQVTVEDRSTSRKPRQRPIDVEKVSTTTCRRQKRFDTNLSSSKEFRQWPIDVNTIFFLKCQNRDHSWNPIFGFGDGRALLKFEC